MSKMLKDIENSKNRLRSLGTREDTIELQSTYTSQSAFIRRM